MTMNNRFIEIMCLPDISDITTRIGQLEYGPIIKNQIIFFKFSVIEINRKKLSNEGHLASYYQAYLVKENKRFRVSAWLEPLSCYHQCPEFDSQIHETLDRYVRCVTWTRVVDYGTLNNQ